MPRSTTVDPEPPACVGDVALAVGSWAPRLVALGAWLLLATTSPGLGQIPTGTLVGSVSDASAAALPGVAVTAKSPNLQGERTTQTNAAGAYKLPFLSPGSYELTFRLDGFEPFTRNVQVSAAQTRRIHVELELVGFDEEIEVRSDLERISGGTDASVTIDGEEVEALPIGRGFDAVVLSPGVEDGSRPAISGSMLYENLWLINGVVVNENSRGGPLPLFIEDAVQETTVSTSGISAEYGRFAGGVINMLTRSGGNDFSGSFRVSLENEAWEAENAGDLSREKVDSVEETFEGTLGGPILTDRIWFFTAARDFEVSDGRELFLRGTPYTFTSSQQRYEGKLTLSLNSRHNLTGSYIDIDSFGSNVSFFDRYVDERQLTGSSWPQSIWALHYTGILGSKLFLEAQASQRNFTIADQEGGPRPAGDRAQDYGASVPIFGSGIGPGIYNSPLFCGECRPESRDNENRLVKLSVFLPTGSWGTHDLVVGVDDFTQRRYVVNHQSGSDFLLVDHDTLVDQNRNPYPVFYSPEELGELAPLLPALYWFPAFDEGVTEPNDLGMRSVFVNDSWQLDERWSFNLGLRYDENDVRNRAGVLLTDDSKLSPRLGATWDVHGDGELLVRASLGTYVSTILETNGISETSVAGELGVLASWYGGPSINTDAACQDDPGPDTCVSPEEAVRRVMSWYFQSFGGRAPAPEVGSIPTIPNLVFASVPGGSAVVAETIASPSVDEITLGVTQRLGSKGLVRIDLVHREWEDFYSNRIDAETIASEDPPGQLPVIGDVTFLGNYGDDVLQRSYLGLHSQFRYRATDRLTLAGSYTWSELEGNVSETPTNLPGEPSPAAYPEYQDPAWAYPVARLPTDQTHKLRLWAIADVLDTERHHLSASILTSYLSGRPYGAVDDVPVRPFVTDDPGYLTPPTRWDYWLTARDAFEEDDLFRTDVSLNYSYHWGLLGRDLEIFVQPEVLNVFNAGAVIDPNTTVHDWAEPQCGGCVPFDPFTETPVEGVHWVKGPFFGQARNENDIQQPRTFQVSLGLRF